MSRCRRRHQEWLTMISVNNKGIMGVINWKLRSPRIEPQAYTGAITNSVWYILSSSVFELENFFPNPWTVRRYRDLPKILIFKNSFPGPNCSNRDRLKLNYILQMLQHQSRVPLINGFNAQTSFSIRHCYLFPSHFGTRLGKWRSFPKKSTQNLLNFLKDGLRKDEMSSPEGLNGKK